MSLAMRNPTAQAPKSRFISHGRCETNYFFICVLLVNSASWLVVGDDQPLPSPSQFCVIPAHSAALESEQVHSSV